MANLMEIREDKFVNAEDASRICAMLDSLCSTQVLRNDAHPLGDLDTPTIQGAFSIYFGMNIRYCILYI